MESGEFLILFTFHIWKICWYKISLMKLPQSDWFLRWAYLEIENL